MFPLKILAQRPGLSRYPSLHGVPEKFITVSDSVSDVSRAEAYAQKISSYQPVQIQILGLTNFVAIVAAIFAATIEPDFRAQSAFGFFGTESRLSIHQLDKSLANKKCNNLKKDLYELMLFQFQPKATMPGKLMPDPAGTSMIWPKSSKNSKKSNFFLFLVTKTYGNN